MYDRPTIIHFARRTILGYRRFVTTGKYTWRECIPRSHPSLASFPDLDANLDAIEAEIAAILDAEARGVPYHGDSPLFDPEQKGKVMPALPSDGRRVIRKGHEFS